MSMLSYVEYSEKAYLQFYCWRCCSDSNSHFDSVASLSRIASLSPDIQRMRQQAETEGKLLSLYNVSLPTLSVPAARDVAVDEPSVCLLHEHNQPILQQFVPASVGADGNCLFRAVSLALYGHEGLYSRIETAGDNRDSSVSGTV